MSRLVEKVKTHLPGHHETVQSSTNPQPNLVRTYHNENTSRGVDTVTYKREDHFEGRKGPVEEKVIEKETITTDLPPKKELPPKPTKIERSVPIPPPLHSTLPQQSTLQQPILDPIQRSVVEKPIIVKERFIPEEKIEIQPIIHRDREVKEVHEVIQPLKERDVMATRVVDATLANQVRAPIVENDANFQVQMREANTRFIPTTEYAPIKSETIEKPVIIQEHIHKTIVEEVQPVLYKETVVPVLVRETQPIYERIVEAPIVFNEERQVRELGTRFVETTLNETQRGVDLQHMGFNNVVYQTQSYGQPMVQPLNQPMAGNSQPTLNKVFEKKVEVYEQKIPQQANVTSTRLV